MESDILLTNDAWRIAIDLDTSRYHEVISAIREDLLLVESQKQEFTPTSELRHVDTLLQQLEAKLESFHQILPRLDRRRGLVNIGGNVLRLLFGTATIADISELQNTLEKLQTQNSDIVHSLNNQVTLVKKLSSAVEVNTDAVANLSSIVKDNLVQSHAKFQQVARDLMWFNITIHAQSDLFTTIRQLEFALLRLIQQLDELTNAIQHAIQGRLPINFINPTVLLGLLKNVSLHLPEGYELIAGVRNENVHLYYELIKVSVIATSHGIKLILHVPLKSNEQRFTLYKIVVLPERVSSEKFIQYVVDHAYFGLNENQRDYLLFTEAQYSRCTKGSIVICPANTAIYHSQTLTCEASLFFQNPNSVHLCQKKLLLRHLTPTLQRHGAFWAYFFPEQHQVTLRCPDSDNHQLRKLSLFGTGLVISNSSCYITSASLRTLPESVRSLQAKLETPSLYLPSNVSAVNNREIHQLEDIVPADVAALDGITAQVTKQKQTFDVDSLVHIHQTSLQLKQHTQWTVVLTTSITVAIILGLLCFVLYSHYYKQSNYPLRTPPNPGPDTREPSSSTDSAQPDENIQGNVSTHRDVVFTAYPARPSH
jgi:hypothetical protein